MRVEILGANLPGRTCNPGPGGQLHENIHVGIRRGRETVELVPGDAVSAVWEVDVDIRTGAAGEVDFEGPFVHGKRGDRYLKLDWVTVDGAENTLFRAAKLRLGEVPEEILRAAGTPGMHLIAQLALTDRKGQPRCASVRPPDVTWTRPRP